MNMINDDKKWVESIYQKFSLTENTAVLLWLNLQLYIFFHFHQWIN